VAGSGGVSAPGAQRRGGKGGGSCGASSGETLARSQALRDSGLQERLRAEGRAGGIVDQRIGEGRGDDASEAKKRNEEALLARAVR